MKAKSLKANHELMFVDIKLNSKETWAMLDIGATCIFFYKLKVK